MSWPLSQDYNEAVQNPADHFADPDLRGGEAVTNALGIPMPRSGNFADVYEVRCPGGGRWAVKCFTRKAAHLRERYLEISRRLRQARMPFTVDFSYLEDGIYVAGQWRPVLKMRWVEGLTLNQFVAQALDRPAMLEALLQIWLRMAKHLRMADVAHCDLQHGNVLLVPAASGHSLRLKLIDYDGMWVPALARRKSGEVGHPAYQHPQRQREGVYSAALDRFPLLLVATALRALMAGGQVLWERYDNGDNLLFREADLREPKQSALFQDLLALGDPATAALTAHVVSSLEGGLESAPPLDKVIADARRAHRSVGRGVGPISRPSTPAGHRAIAAPPTAAALAVPAPAAPDPWDFDAPNPEADPHDSLTERRSKSRRARSPVKTGVKAASAMGAAAALLAALSFWAFAASQRPEPPAPDGRPPQRRPCRRRDQSVWGQREVIPGPGSRPRRIRGRPYAAAVGHTPGVPRQSSGIHVCTPARRAGARAVCVARRQGGSLAGGRPGCLQVHGG